MLMRPLLASLLATALVAWTPGADADVRSQVTRLQAERLAEDGRCDDAVARLAPIVEAHPEDARAARVMARCLIRLERWAEATPPLEATIDADPGDAQAHLLLGIARYHLGVTEGAAAELDAARAKGASGADLEFYTALVRLRSGDQRGAAEAFEHARATDAARVEPLASYFEGLAWEQAGDPTAAHSSMTRAVDAGPEDPWSTRARSALDRIDRQRRATAKRRWFEATAGFELDDNVILRGNHVALPSSISDEDDVRLVWGAEGGLELVRTHDWSLGVMAGYAGTAHQDLSKFNQHFLSGSVWIDRRLGEEWVARLQYDTGFAFVDAQSFLFPQSVTPSIFRGWSNGQQTRLYSRFYWNDFRFANGPDVAATPVYEPKERERDGHGTTVGLEHKLPIASLRTDMTAGLAFHRYFSRGREYSFRGHEASLETRSLLPGNFVLELGASWAYAPYRHASTYRTTSNENRRDRIWRFSVAIEREISDRMTATLRYRYVDDDSNVRVFDYDRGVFGFYLTRRWD